MRLSVTRKVLILIAIPLLFQVVCLGLLAWARALHTRDQEQSNRGTEVIAQVNLVLRLMVDAEAGIRGYALTDDSEFAEPYDRARQVLPDHLHRLRDLTQHDSDRRTGTTRIENSANDSLNWLEKTNEMIRLRKWTPETHRITRDGTTRRIRDGKQLMDTLRNDADQFIASENREAEVRQDRIARSGNWVNGLLIGSALSALFITGGFTVFFWRGLGRRFTVLTANIERLAAGKELIAPLDGGDEVARVDKAFHQMAREINVSAMKLRHTADEISDLYNNAPCGYHSVDGDGNIVAINETELKWLGYKSEEVIGKIKYYDLMTDRCRREFQEFFPGFQEVGAVNNIEYEYVRKDGSILPVLVSATAIRDEAGLYLRSRSTVFDLTERKKVEESLRRSTERFRLLVELAVDYSLIILDPCGHVATWNIGAERMKGYRAHEIIGKHFSCFYPPEVAGGGWPEEELRRAAAEGRFEDEGWRVRKDGSRFWANVVFTALHNAKGEIEGFSKITRDLTERKRTEEDMEDRVRHRTAELADANRDLSQKNQENEMFVYSVSHDLRSPLVNLQGFSKELGKGCETLKGIFADERLPGDVRTQGQSILDGKMTKSLHFIQTAVLRLSNIIDALLRLSRAGRIEYRWQWVDLKRLVVQIGDSMQTTMAEKGATLHIGDLPAVWGDATALEQVFANLIGNALKYLDPKRPGRLEVGFRSPSEGANAPEGFNTYFVRDNGLGIAPVHHNKIFQVFQRVHPGVAPGEGMGLAIVARVIERHRGRIWIESAEGVGSTFFLSFPHVGN